ncbi:carboxymuconolactone decarboxylase family protein [Dysgonomonas macrotermitis]|uniref:Alkylhydroperoxidase AhpD family core domain-containing protein n=1 Tax=Dysgonomonas macrotermitis TaxID=1346286 RepID=A0A1M5IF61_9BACT|nr:carboxymuconolactone decarboxylase family protein [Dysgonomonas macrotermitis]SHG26988.1 alkylhydroperoxidase AhpD family core domain-containing protein [Dysgonomonas macrotermitis]
METKRLNMYATAPELYKAMLSLENALQQTSLTPIEKELIKIRASQINGCAFCLNMHTRDARKIGETEQRIYLLNAWHETNLYTDTEKIILQLTEEITHISKGGVSDATYREAEKILGTPKLAEVIMAVVVINAWNRIAIATTLPVD